MSRWMLTMFVTVLHAYKQEKARQNADSRRGTVIPTFKVGDFDCIRCLTKRAKNRKFSKPLQIVKPKGRYTYMLENGRVWNASKLSTCPASLMTQTGSPKSAALQIVTDTRQHLRRSKRARQTPVWMKDYQT